ncbi:MAG: phosphatidylserine decarboxylase [Candidatus Kapabacteria bacterium]|nr:phosphatidylserine decarboxylase [Candidatus Kapabacteria bacterium]MDW8011562.1 phosphatidylserine decarboxylase [Bacteroidota bacterium]
MPLITPYGRDNAVALLGTAVTLGAVGVGVGGALGWLLGGGAAAIAGLTLWFFRDPERRLPAGAWRDGVLVAPADGRIVQIASVHEPEFLGGEAVCISIFLSLLDVHVNRVPVSGVVQFCRYVPGRFYAAYRSEASQQNEQMIVGVETPRGRVLFRQIAGVLARRIVCDLCEGQRVQAAERFGMIKFGSRVEVLVPLSQAEIVVQVGMRVRAGETVLGYLRPSVSEEAAIQALHGGA